MESGLPPALENEWLLRKRHLLGQTCSHSDSAESREGLCDPVHAECPCYVSGKGGGNDLHQAISLRHVCRHASPAFLHGTSDTWLSAPAPHCCAASPHERRERGGAIPGIGCRNASMRRTGRDGRGGALAKSLKTSPKAVLDCFTLLYHVHYNFP